MCGKRKSSWYWVSSWPGTFITPDEHCALPLPHGGRLVIQGAHSRPGLHAQLRLGLDVGQGVHQVLEQDNGEVGGLKFTLLWGPQDKAAQLCQGARMNSSPRRTPTRTGSCPRRTGRRGTAWRRTKHVRLLASTDFAN